MPKRVCLRKYSFLFFLFLGKYLLSGVYQTPHSVIFFSKASQKELAKRVGEEIERSYQTLQNFFNFIKEKPDKVKVKLCHSVRELKKYLREPFPQAAVDPRARVIIIPPPQLFLSLSYNLTKIIKHELCHVFLHHFLPPGSLPQWFDEGLAMYLSGESIFKRFPTQPILMISSLTNFPSETRKLRAAYQTSLNFILFLVKEYGEVSLKKILWLCAHSKLNLEEALRKVLGKNITTVEKEFLIEMKQRGRWIRIISSSFFFWFLLSSAFVGAYFIKRAKARRLINQWEEEEAREDVQGY